VTEIGPIKPAAFQAAPEADLTGAARRLQSAAPQDVRKAAEGFEAVFLNQFVGTMFSGMKADGLFGGGNGEKMWQGFLVQHIADAFAQRGGIGIADMVVAEMTRASEAPLPDTAPAMNAGADTGENPDDERD
jgi:Rod binding domain-containing protein